MTEVRVRFAPSPTGFVHVGSIRTALYNYLFSRHHKGKFILRIEDTDQTRYVEGAVENLLEALNWAGLEYDEGPGKESDCKPFYQSERRDIYNKYIKILLEKGAAYPCFCSEERLEKMREAQAAKNQSVMYDGRCRSIDPDEAAKRVKKDRYVIRMRIPQSGETVIEDLIRGRVSFQNELIDDQILIKSDGFPTYHLANVVDDHLMGITHVIRGEEWLPSTPKHALLYQAFGWKLPAFAHLPLLLNTERGKLSKSQKDTAVEDYQKKGILPQSLINFVALLGWNRGDDQEIFSMDELIGSFSLERVNKAGAIFDLQKLYWMNGHYIRNISEEAYLETGRKWLKKLDIDTDDPEKNKLMLLAVRKHLDHFAELKEQTALFFQDRLSYSEEAESWVKNENSKTIFKKMLSELENYEQLTLDDFKAIMKTVQKSVGIKGKDLWMPVRSAITGLTEGPELPYVISVIGKSKVANFLKQAIDK